MSNKPVTILLAAAALAASVATAQAQVPHQRADGLWVCPNDENRVLVNGDWRVACYTDVPSISMEEFKKLRAQSDRADAAEAARWRKLEQDRCRTEQPRPASCDGLKDGVRSTDR
jgi:hypothetical protein